MNREKLDNIRALVAILVLFGHSIIIYDPHWTLYSNSNSSVLLYYIKQYINLIQILLFFLSGWCFNYKIKKCKNMGEGISYPNVLKVNLRG